MMPGGEAERPLHVPVMADEVVELLAPVSGGVYLDCNLGLGGHAELILERSGPDGVLVGLDWDAEALAMAKKKLSRFGRRAIAVRSNFARAAAVLDGLGLGPVDGVLLDLGLSSLQLAANRGFSFSDSESLDMRMDDRAGESARDLVNRCSEAELADIIYNYGEERQARRIAAAIVAERKAGEIRSGKELADIVYRAVPRRFHPGRIHVATRTFQALRIAVNRELDNLAELLASLPRIMAGGARVCVISFHSLEDRLVKRCFSDRSLFRPLTKKPLRAREEECSQNPRSRSARLRAATYCGLPL